MVKGNARRGFALALALVLALCLMSAGALAAEKKAVRIGVVPSESVKVLLERYQPLMDYLSQKTGRPFELRPSKSYEEIVDQLKSGELDGGIMGSFVAQKAIRTISAVPVARPDKGGVSTYRGYIIVRKDSGAKKIEDLKGKSFDFVSRDTSAGYVFPRALLKEKGIDPEKFFARVTFAGKHDIAVSKVLNKESDGGAVKDNVFEKLSKGDPRVAGELTVIHKSERFPDSTIMFRKETSADLLKSVREALLGMEKDPAGKNVLSSRGVDRYIPTGLKDFNYLEKLQKELGAK
jgi:phosphonate transport system substrate-binding protein